MVKETVQKLMSVLRDPNLPLLELQVRERERERERDDELYICRNNKWLERERGLWYDQNG